jgi:hypothetical protein
MSLYFGKDRGLVLREAAAGILHAGPSELKLKAVALVFCIPTPVPLGEHEHKAKKARPTTAHL